VFNKEMHDLIKLQKCDERVKLNFTFIFSKLTIIMSIDITLNNYNRIHKINICKNDDIVEFVSQSNVSFIVYNNIKVKNLCNYKLDVDIQSNKQHYAVINDSNTSKQINIDNNNFTSMGNKINIKLCFVKAEYKIYNIYLTNIDYSYLTQINIFPIIQNKVTVNTYFNKVYILNRDVDSDRLNNVKTRLENFDINFERFSAVDGNDLDETIINKYAYGCYASHIKILKDALVNNYDKILILEDDVYFHKDFINGFRWTIANIPDNWDILYLGCSQQKNTWSYIECTNNYYKSQFCNGTFAYCVKLSVIQQMLNILEKRIGYIDTIYHNIQKTHNCFTIVPNLIISDVTQSTMRKNRNQTKFSKIVGWHLPNYKIE